MTVSSENDMSLLDPGVKGFIGKPCFILIFIHRAQYDIGII